jgi:hypothetical protein
MEPYSEQAYRDAWLVQVDAEALAGVKWYQRGKADWLAVLPRWTAWLLMEKAGVPVDLIALVVYADLRSVRRGILAAKALMIWPPYAANIEKLMEKMPRYGVAHVPVLKPAKDRKCVVAG